MAVTPSGFKPETF